MANFRLFQFFCFFLFSFQAITAESIPYFIRFQGHLSQKNQEQFERELQSIPDKTETLVLEVNSHSGDLTSVLEIARQLYEFRVNRNVKIIVYIENEAIGPAAIFPFLADELHSSVFANWGLIVVEGEDLKRNLLRSKVRSLIDPKHPKASLLKVLADGMSDEKAIIVDQGPEKGWQLMGSEDLGDAYVLSDDDEALVIDHNQMRELGLLRSLMPIERFRQQFEMPDDIAENLKQPLKDFRELVVSSKQLQDRLAEHITFSEKGPNYVGHIRIDDRTSGIDQSTWIYVKAALEYYKKTKPVMIVLELNTPGGQVYAAQLISDALKDIDTIHGIPVVAYVNNWAISAGAMLAYSCRFIAVVKDASMGAAAPVFAGAGGEMTMAPEKVNSALRTDFANRARFFERNPSIAEAMVDDDLILVLRHGEVLVLNSEEEIRTSGSDPDQVITRKDKLLTLSSEQTLEYGVADLLVEPVMVVVPTESELAEGKWPASKSRLFHHPFFKKIPNSIMDSYQMDWRTRFLAILAMPAVASFLFMGMMVGFYVEMQTPGMGLPGMLAVICLGFIVLSSFALEAIQWIELFFVLMGVILILLEAFVIPGFGLPGILGVTFLVGGLFAITLPAVDSVSYEWDTGTLNAAGEVFMSRLAWLCASLVMGVGIIAFLGAYVLPGVGRLSRLVSLGEQNHADGYVSGLDLANMPPLGSIGEAASPLRPAGKVLIENEVYDAVSNGKFLEKGAKIRVAELSGVRMVVEAVKEE